MHHPPTWTATQKAQILVAAQRRRASAGAGETRVIAGLTAEVEKRALAWMAVRMPEWVTPDHLTVLGLLAMLLGGAAYAASGAHPWLLLVVNGALALNWFGDSLDGTLARFRQRQRPRYGFYVDHFADALGALGLLGGLALSGLASPPLVWTLVLVYYLFSIHMYLATHALGRFQISYGPVGPRHPRPGALPDLLRPRGGDRAANPARPGEPVRARLARDPAPRSPAGVVRRARRRRHPRASDDPGRLGRQRHSGALRPRTAVIRLAKAASWQGHGPPSDEEA